jgi:hypothetical protein
LVIAAASASATGEAAMAVVAARRAKRASFRMDGCEMWWTTTEGSKNIEVTDGLQKKETGYQVDFIHIVSGCDKAVKQGSKSRQ